MSLEKLREKRRRWVETNRENGFDEGINNLLTQLYPDNAHFIYELMQNAEDPGATLVRFTLTDSEVEFEHNGERLFSLENVESITGIGVSTKRDDPTSIGKFGVGFKAVFAYTNTPEIHSGNFHFRIHDLVVPETDGVRRPQMGERETRFIFPFDNQKKIKKQAAFEVERGLRALGGNTLLFLTNIRKIEYLLPDSSLGILERIEHEGGHIETRTIQPGREETVFHWLRFEKDVEVTDEDGKSKNCRIAIAYSLAEDENKEGRSIWKVVPLYQGQVSIYFPAEKEPSNLRFHLHAPFASTVARDSVRDCEANRELRDHLAALAAESLETIRDQGLLTVGFLAVLPNPQDNLPSFYEPISKAMVKAFKDKPLTPTRSGMHAPAGGLYRGPARIQEVLDDEDLSQLTLHRSLLWAKNPRQENQREARFLDSLEIETWGWSALAGALDKPHSYQSLSSPQQWDNNKHKNLIENWIAKKEDSWLLRFYALLGEACDAHSRSVSVDDLRIIRVASNDGNQHVTPREAYFSPENETKVLPSDMLFVKLSTYTDGGSEAQKKFAKSFLGHAGVQPYDDTVDIERVLEQYRSGQSIPLETHIGHVQQFVIYWQNNPNSAAKFKGIAFLMAEGENGNEHYFKASDLYLDSPYVDTGLEALFSDNTLTIEKPKTAGVNSLL